MKTRSTELTLFALLLALANLPLLFGRVCEPLLFEPARVAAGEWWRVVTGPFVHVSGYHLLLDAGAFLMLYHGLREPSFAKRLLLVAAPAAGSMLVSLPSLLAGGGSLCGLSGVAHGLLAVSALELMDTRDRTLARVGAACLLIVAGKSVIEAFTGHALFESWHLGDVATPVAICHLGGVLGGLLAYAGLAASGRHALRGDRHGRTRVYLHVGQHVARNRLGPHSP
jgi:rhomboid family GlyGly-CTERM serine protease